MRAAVLAAAIWSATWLSSCARDVQLCDAGKLQTKALEGVAACQAKGFEWVDCPDRPRVLAELEKELGKCSSN